MIGERRAGVGERPNGRGERRDESSHFRFAARARGQYDPWWQTARLCIHSPELHPPVDARQRRGQYCGDGSIGSFMYVPLILETLLREGHMKPAHFSHTPPGAIGNYVILPLAAQMLVLSLRD